jgi:hypothetical protein
MTKPADSMIVNEWTESYRCLPLMCLLPRLLRSCRDIVGNKHSQTAGKIESLAASATRFREAFLDMADKHGWRPGRYSPVLAPRDIHSHPRVFCDAADQAAANYGNYLSGLTIVNRIIFALRPSAKHLEVESQSSALEIQYLHSHLKTESVLQGVYLVHSERVALSVALTLSDWGQKRSQENGRAFDPDTPDGGNIVERWKFDKFDDILCARAVDAPLM